MVVEIDTGTWIETEEISAIQLSPDGKTFVIVDSMPYEATRFSFEMLLSMMRQREAQATDLAY